MVSSAIQLSLLALISTVSAFTTQLDSTKTFRPIHPQPQPQPQPQTTSNGHVLVAPIIRTKDVSLSLEVQVAEVVAITMYGLGVYATAMKFKEEEPTTKETTTISSSSEATIEGFVEEELGGEETVVEVVEDASEESVEIETIEEVEEIVAVEDPVVVEEEVVEESTPEPISTPTPTPSTSIFEDTTRQLDETFAEMTKMTDLKKFVASTLEGEREKFNRLKSSSSSSESEMELEEESSSVAVLEKEEEEVGEVDVEVEGKAAEEEVVEQVPRGRKRRFVVKVVKKVVRPWKKWSSL